MLPADRSERTFALVGGSDSYCHAGYEAGALTGYFAGDRKADRPVFSYESSMLKEFRHVSLTARDESLSYCLKRLFEPLPLVYRITGRYVILKRKPRQYTISGFVRDSASYESLIAATVVERSSGKGSVSNNYGFYSITLSPGKVVLSSSYVGYEPVPLRSS